MKRFYVPDRGDIVWIEFNPQLGHEQANSRPALVLSPKSYNDRTSLCLICPMTSKIKNYPFEVLISSGRYPSVVLSDQIKSLDWKARGAVFKSKVDPVILMDVVAKLSVLISN